MVILYIYPTFQLHLWSQLPIETIQASQCGLHPTKIWSGFLCFHSHLFSILFSLHAFLNKVGIYIWVFTPYLPLYIYGNLNNLGNVHILSLFPLAIYQMPLLTCCTRTAYFLRFYKCTHFYHFISIIPVIPWLFCDFSYCGLWYIICFFMDYLHHCTSILHIILH